MRRLIRGLIWLGRAAPVAPKIVVGCHPKTPLCWLPGASSSDIINVHFIHSAPYNFRIVVILIPAPKVLLWCADKGSSFNSSQPTSVILILVSKREANCQCTPDTSPLLLHFFALPTAYEGTSNSISRSRQE